MIADGHPNLPQELYSFGGMEKAISAVLQSLCHTQFYISHLDSKIWQQKDSFIIVYSWGKYTDIH